MMTDYQRQLFSKLVDLNWESKKDYDQIIKNALINEYFRVEEELMDDMGRAEYRAYVDGFRRMFAPVGGYGDESLEEMEYMMESVR